MNKPFALVIFIMLLAPVCGCATVTSQSFPGYDGRTVWIALTAVAESPSYDDLEPSKRWLVDENQSWADKQTGRIEIFRRVHRMEGKRITQQHRNERTWRFQVIFRDGTTPSATFAARGMSIPTQVLDEADRYFADVRELLRGVEGMMPQTEAPETQPETVALAITDVAIIDVRSGMVQNRMTLVIEDNRIKTVGNSRDIEIPDGARIVEGSGKYVIPGLWDMHVHVFNQISLRPPNTHYFPLFIANGVTSIRELWTKPENMEQVRKWRRQQEAGTLLAPRFAAVGILVDGPGGAAITDPAAALLGPNATVADTPEAGRLLVRKAKAAGLDFVKTYSSLSRETYFAIAEEARRVGIPFAGHVPFAVDASEAAAAGQKSMEHLNQILESSSLRYRELLAVPGAEWSSAHDKLMLDTFDADRFRELVSVLAFNQTWQTPTLVMERIHRLSGDARELLDDTRLKYVPRQEVELWKTIFADQQRSLSPEEKETRRRRWKRTLEVVRAMRDAQIPFLAGTDVGNDNIYPGFSLHDELALLVEAGLTNLEALQAATINPARFLGQAKNHGTVEAGKRADLVILSSNPLEDIRNTTRIHAVIVNGRLLRRDQLDALLADNETHE